MVQVVIGDTDDFNALVYGAQAHPGTLNYLENQFSGFSQTLTDAGKQFFSNARQMFEHFHGSEAVRIARAAIRKAGSLFQRDEIRSIWDLGQLQQAPLTMQRYIMANPVVRERFNQQTCDGYSETYKDWYPNTIGLDHYDYRRVMDGVVQELPEDDPDGDWVCREHIEDLVEGDRALTTEEKADIFSTWDAVEALMEMGGEDPTSPFANKL